MKNEFSSETSRGFINFKLLNHRDYFVISRYRYESVDVKNKLIFESSGIFLVCHALLLILESLIRLLYQDGRINTDHRTY